MWLGAMPCTSSSKSDIEIIEKELSMMSRWTNWSYPAKSIGSIALPGTSGSISIMTWSGRRQKGIEGPNRGKLSRENRFQNPAASCQDLEDERLQRSSWRPRTGLSRGLRSCIQRATATEATKNTCDLYWIPRMPGPVWIGEWPYERMNNVQQGAIHFSYQDAKVYYIRGGTSVAFWKGWGSDIRSESSCRPRLSVGHWLSQTEAACMQANQAVSLCVFKNPVEFLFSDYSYQNENPLGSQ